MQDNLKIGLQYCAPKHALTRFAGKLASLKAGMLTTAVIRWFIGRYKVDMSEARNPDPAAYVTFNDFFVRELKEGARPINDEADIISHPADACVSQLGPITEGRLFQPKVITLMPLNYWAETKPWLTNSRTASLPPCICHLVITTVSTCHVTGPCVR